MTLRIGSLCSGYGGLDMAVEAAFDATTAWFVEYDKAPTSILSHNYPNIPNYGDLTLTDWTTVEPVDILTGGYPCQPFSHAGKREGANDERHIWPWIGSPEQASAVRILRPRWCIFENVGGHLSLGLGDVLADLAALGYDCRWGSLRAADVGAPHGRLRVFILASRRDNPHQSLPPAAALSDGLAATGSALFPTPTAQASKHGETPDLHAHSFGSNLWDMPFLLPTPIAADGTKASSNPDTSARRRAEGRQPFLTDIVQTDLLPDALLPTPQARDHKDAALKESNHRPGDTDSVPRAIFALLAASNASTPLLPTPKASDGPKGGPGQRNGKGEPDSLPAISALLPTPSASDATGAEFIEQRASRGAGGASLRDVPELLPTPTPFQLGNSETPEQWVERRADVIARTGTHHGLPLPVAAESIADGNPIRLSAPMEWKPAPPANQPSDVAWGPYEPAIRRWERVTNRPAPNPTEPGTSGRPRLSPRFVEWMMGLPDGHVTSTPGLARGPQLKALGNGVCPQQAYVAILNLLHVDQQARPAP